MPSLAQLRRQVADESRIVDGLTEEFARDLAGVMTRVTAQSTRLLGELETKRGRLVATKAALARSLRLRDDLATVLREAGFESLVADAVDERLDELLAKVLRGRSLMQRSATLTALDVDVLEAWRAVRAADLLEIGEDAVQALWRATVDGVTGARDVTELTGEIAELLNVSQRSARTVHDTAISTFARQSDLVGIEPNPGDRFVYVGPNDTETRPFCRDHIGQVKTREELGGISNGQIPNTLLTGGGWNCRHKWMYLADAAPPS